MEIISRIFVVLGLMACLTTLPARQAMSAPCSLNAPNCRDGTVSVKSDGYEYSFDGRVLRRAGVSRERETEDDGRVIEYQFTPACWANQGGDGPGDADVDCTVSSNAGQCAPDEMLFRRYSREVAPNPQPNWSQPGQLVCRGAVQSWTVPELSRLIEPEFRQALVEQPVITLNPSPRALVHLPVIASVQPLQPVGFSVTNPVPGEVAGTPSYVWDFGEGATFRGPGRAYDGTLPSQQPDYYIAHTYHTRGAKTVTLTVHWQGVFTVAGIEIPLEPIELSYANPVEIVEARSRLIAGDT
jgi:hypothetical protein